MENKLTEERKSVLTETEKGIATRVRKFVTGLNKTNFTLNEITGSVSSAFDSDKSTSKTIQECLGIYATHGVILQYLPGCYYLPSKFKVK